MNPKSKKDHPQPNDVDRMVCERLRARRLLLGLSQTDIAMAAGLSPQQIHKYETGTSRLTAGRLAQFASILNVPLSYFYDDLDIGQKLPQRLIKLLADPGTIELLQHYWKLPKHLRTATLAYVRVVASETAKTRSCPPVFNVQRERKAGQRSK